MVKNFPFKADDFPKIASLQKPYIDLQGDTAKCQKQVGTNNKTKLFSIQGLFSLS